MTQFPSNSKHNPGERDVLENREKQKARNWDQQQRRGPKKPRPERD